MLCHPCLLLGLAAPTTIVLGALRPLRGGGVLGALAAVIWLAVGPWTAVAAAAARFGSADAALAALGRDSAALGAPDRKLLYACLGYVPLHASALAFLAIPRADAKEKGD